MAAPVLARVIAQRWQQASGSVHRFDQRTHRWLGMLADAAKQALKPASATMAAAIADFAVFSSFHSLS